MPGRSGGSADNPRPATVDVELVTAPADPSFVVGVVDTGLTLHEGAPHPFVAGHLTPDSLDGDVQDVLPDAGRLLGRFDGHGTFVAGRILMEAPSASIAMRKALDLSPPPGGLSGDDLVALRIRELAGIDELKLVNFSFYGEDTVVPDTIGDALRDLFDRHPEVVVVTAAGNHWDDEVYYPSAFKRDFPQVVSVGAVDDSVYGVAGYDLPRAAFSNYSAAVDLYAPGVRVLGPHVWHEETDPDPGHREPLEPTRFTGWSRWSGTSFAAATVTGLLADSMLGLRCSAREALELLLRAPTTCTPVPGAAPKPCVQGRYPDHHDG